MSECTGRIALSDRLTGALEAAARQNQVTVNTMVQAAWALLLSRYSDRRDVVFGMTVSGRPADLRDVEKMVGLFITTLPLRLRVDPAMSVKDWLQEVQSGQIAVRQHDSTPQSAIQEWSGFPHGVPLFESTLVFENYPVEKKEIEEQAVVLDLRDDYQFGTRTGAAITLVLIPGTPVHLRISFDCSRFDLALIQRLTDHLEALLTALASDLERPVSAVPMLTEQERERLRQWGRIEKPPAAVLSAVGLCPEPVAAVLVETSARESLDSVASLGGGGGPASGSTGRTGREEGGANVPEAGPGVEIRILDADLQPVPVGVPGRLYVRQTAVRDGSGGASEHDADRWVNDPLGGAAGESFRATSARGRWRGNGALDVLGELETTPETAEAGQDPAAGKSLGRIEGELAEHPEIAEAFARLVESPMAGARVVAYVVPSTSTVPSTQSLRAFLKARLGGLELPSDYVVLPELPRGANGEVDCGELPPPQFAHSYSKVLLVGDVASHDILEYQLARIWEEVFDTRPINPGDNFFGLGGDSMTALALISRIGEELGYDLPLATLFEGGSIREMAEVIRRDSGASAWSPLVPIRTHGARRPFFCVHAAGGNVLGFVDLLQHLGREQPFYGLQSFGLDGRREPHSSVEEMAAQYIEEIRTIQAKGPYCLGGLSFGGIVAFEMARQLKEKGEETALLALIDTWAPVYEGELIFRKILPADDFTLLTHYVKGIRHFYDQHPEKKARLVGLSLGEQIGMVLDHMGSTDLFRGVSSEHARRVLRIHLHSARAVRDYVPRVYEGKITVFRAAEAGPESHFVILHPALGRPEIMAGWRGLSNEPPEVVDVPGDHITMIVEPHVRVLGEQLDELLGRVG